MDIDNIILKLLGFIGWTFRTFILKPYNWFMDLKFKYKLFIILFILTIFDTLRQVIFRLIIKVLV